MDSKGRENYSVFPILGVGAVLLTLLSGLFGGCCEEAINVSMATKHIATGETTWTFEVWGTEAGTSVNFNVSSDVDWLTVSPASGTSTGPSNRVLVTVTVAAGVPTGSTAVIEVRSGLTRKVIDVTTAPNYFTAEYANGIPLADTSLVFSPLAGGGYSEEVLEVLAFLTNPVGGTTLNLATEDCVKVDLANAKTVPFYGELYSSIYVNQNGVVSFDSCSTVGTLEQHFGAPGISALTTAAASDGGVVSVKQTADRLAITFENVPSLDNATGLNNFQIELFFNGTIRLTYLDLMASGSIIGLSSGNGLPANFLPSELTENYNTGGLKAE